jgi:GNAT superfamily N-acetyltransferase
MNIRFATPEDAIPVAEMVEKFYQMAMAEMLGDYDKLAAANLIAATSVSSDACTIVAEDGDRIIGTMGALSYNHPFKPSVRIAQELFWWVEPEYRKSGIGQKMMDAGEQWAKEIGCSGMVMVTMHGIDHERNGAFYERSGYGPFEHSYLKRF